MGWAKALRPTLLREIGAVYVALSAVGLANFAAVVYLLRTLDVSAGVEVAAAIERWAVALAGVNLALLAWGLWATARRVALPVRRLREAAKRAAAGDLGARVDAGLLFDELGEAAREFNTMEERLQSTLSRLEEQRNFSQALIERMPAGVCVVDGRGRIRYVNPALRALLAGEGPPPVGREIAEALPVPGIERLVAQALVERKTVHGIQGDALLPRSPAPARLSLSAGPMWPSPQAPERALLIVEDRTEEARAARQRREWQDMLLHDVKQPLTMVLSSVRALLMEGGVGGPERGLLENAKRGGESILEMLQSYLDVLRMESGAYALRRVPLRLAEAARGAAGDFSRPASDRGVAIEVAVSEEIVIEADEALLRRMLGNLLDNAVRHSGKGSVVGIRAERADAGVRVEVWDRGEGIPPEALARVFERFYRVPGTAHRGSGLGLAFCKLAADLHGWGISVASRPGQGTVVRIEAGHGNG